MYPAETLKSGTMAFFAMFSSLRLFSSAAVASAKSGRACMAIVTSEFNDGNAAFAECIFTAHFDYGVGLATHQGIQMCARHLGVAIEADHVLGEPRQGDLRLEDLNLRNLADAVLDARRCDRLLRDAYVLIMDTQIVLRTQQVEEGFPHIYADPQSSYFEIVLCHFHIGLSDIGAQPPLASAWEGLTQHQHVLRCVVVPRPGQRHLPSAVHRLWIVERACQTNMCFGSCNLSRGNMNLWILSKRDSLNLVQGQRRGSRVLCVSTANQCAQLAQSKSAFCSLPAANWQNQHEAKRPRQ